MKFSFSRCGFLAATLFWAGPAARAAVQITAFLPSLSSPQPLGTSISWRAVAVDTNPCPLTFQFNITPPNGSPAMTKDFNVGLHVQTTWKSQAFQWMPTQVDGTFQIEVVAKDFASGESDARTVSFSVTSPLTGRQSSCSRDAESLSRPVRCAGMLAGQQHACHVSAGIETVADQYEFQSMPAALHHDI